MRILHFLVTDRLSGAENVAIDILKGLSGENEVFYASPDGPIREAVEAAGIPFIAVNTESISEIRRVYRELSPDIVHANDPRMSFKCALSGIPFIAQYHNNCPWMRKPSPNALGMLFTVKRAEAVIAVSDSIVNEYCFKRALSKKVRVIPNTVDREKVIKGANEPFDKNYDICFVGRLNEQKDPLLFLRTVLEIKKTLPHVTAVMVGEGELLFEVKEFIEKNGLDGVTLHGFDKNPYRIMKNSKINVFTSSWEGFGLVAVESLILGLPVLAYPVGGLAAIVNDGCGALCGSVTEMADEAVRLLSDSEYCKKKSDGARLRSENYTDMEKYLDRVKAVYADVTENRKGGGK